MTNERDGHEPLSAEGASRKDAILLHAQQALAGRQRSRRARKSLVAAILLVGGATALVVLVPRPATVSREVIARAPHVEPSRNTQRPPAFERLNDDELLAALASMGVEAGLIEIDGKQRLVTPEGGEIDRSRWALHSIRRDDRERGGA